MRRALGLRGFVEHAYMTPELAALAASIERVVAKFSRYGTVLLYGDIELGHHVHYHLLSAILDVLLKHGPTVWPKRDREANQRPRWLYDVDSGDGSTVPEELERNLVFRDPETGVDADYAW